MITALMREQLRSQGRYAFASLGLVVLATSFLSFLVVSTDTAARESDAVRATLGATREHQVMVPMWTNGQPVDAPDYLVSNALSDQDIDSALGALDPDARAAVTLQADVLLVGDPIRHIATSLESLPAESLIAGSAPGQGEVALARPIAESLGVSVGDRIGLTDASGHAAAYELTLSGIVRSASKDSQWQFPLIVLNPADAASAFEASGLQVFHNAHGAPTALATASLNFDGAVPATLEPYVLSPYSAAPDLNSRPVGITSVALGLTLISALISAAAAGRSQASARHQWVGTVRAMGGTRRTLAVAAIGEVVALGLAGSLAGLGLGFGAAQWIVRSGGGTFIGDDASLTLAGAAGVLGVGLVLAALLGVAPVLWAARSTAADALRAVPATDLPRRRNRAVLWLSGAVAAGAGVGLLARARASGSGADWPQAALIATAITFGLANYWLGVALMERLAVRLGGFMARSHHTLLLTAGLGLIQRPRSAAWLAATIAAGGSVAGGAVWWWTVHPGTNPHSNRGYTWDDTVTAAATATVGTAAVMAAGAIVVGAAVWIARGAIARDSAVLGALGLGRHARQLAAMVELAAAGVMGACVGLAWGGTLMASATTILGSLGQWEPIPSPDGPQAWLQGALVAAGALLGLCLVVATIALVAARASDGTSPSDLRRKAERSGRPL